MLFNSLSFLIFFPVVTVLYFLLPDRFRWAWLLVASCVFYMFFIPAYILILLVTILIDYFAAIWIEDTASVARRRSFLIASVLSTCAVLFIFKYFNFFNINFAMLAQLLGFHYPAKVVNIILPIGLSFHTFQSLSYVIEVFLKRQKAERHFGIYSLYVMFYPQLVAGPIERPQNLLHQFREKHVLDYHDVSEGLKLMAWGLFKKVVIADRLAVLVNHVYSRPGDYDGLSLALATVCFAYQIYCDFSGYSDMARGAARVMGFKLMVNFRRPYAARSVQEFWSRWHISLSTWFRDYVYIPLGGSRSGTWKTLRNLFITFLVSGLWHGANWTFIIWGGINGAYVSLQSLWAEVLKRGSAWRDAFVPAWAGVAGTFCLICLAWVFFRVESAPQGFMVVKRILMAIGDIPHLLLGGADAFRAYLSGKGFGLKSGEIGMVMGFILLMECVEFVHERHDMGRVLRQWPVWGRWPAYYALCGVIMVCGVFGNNQFIYFQF